MTDNETMTDREALARAMFRGTDWDASAEWEREVFYELADVALEWAAGRGLGDECAATMAGIALNGVASVLGCTKRGAHAVHLDPFSDTLWVAGNADETITIPRPHVPYGPAGVPERVADADYLRAAVRNLKHLSQGERIWGSNLTATVVKLLTDSADALTPKEG
jgi:hypothetical protein